MARQKETRTRAKSTFHVKGRYVVIVALGQSHAQTLTHLLPHLFTKCSSKNTEEEVIV